MGLLIKQFISGYLKTPREYFDNRDHEIIFRGRDKLECVLFIFNARSLN